MHNLHLLEFLEKLFGAVCLVMSMEQAAMEFLLRFTMVGRAEMLVNMVGVCGCVKVCESFIMY